jgi:hypothetical protein
MKIFMWTASFMYVLVEAVFPLNTFLFPSALLIIRYPGTSVSRRHCPSILGSLVFGGKVSPAVALPPYLVVCHGNSQRALSLNHLHYIVL